MQDGIMTNNGNSRYLRTVRDALTRYPTYEDFMAALIAGEFPVDLHSFNMNGWDRFPTLLNKATLLSDETAARLNLPPDQGTGLPNDTQHSRTPNNAINALIDVTEDLCYKVVRAQRFVGRLRRDNCPGVLSFKEHGGNTFIAIVTIDGAGTLMIDTRSSEIVERKDVYKTKLYLAEYDTDFWIRFGDTHVDEGNHIYKELIIGQDHRTLQWEHNNDLHAFCATVLEFETADDMAIYGSGMAGGW